MGNEAPLHRCAACGELVRLLPGLRDLDEVPGTCACGAETVFLKVGSHLAIWTVYDHPRDFPDVYVARLSILDKPTAKILKADNLADLRAQLPIGLTCLPRSRGDDPVILECWL